MDLGSIGKYRKISFLINLSVFCVVLSILLLSCGTVKKIDIPFINNKSPSEQEKIITVLDNLEKLIERKQVKRAMNYVSIEYKDEQNRKYNDIREYLQSIVRDYRVVRITRATPEIKVEGNLATVYDTFGTVAEPYDAVQGVPVNIQGKVIITLQKEPEGWKIKSWSSLL